MIKYSIVHIFMIFCMRDKEICCVSWTKSKEDEDKRDKEKAILKSEDREYQYWCS